MIRFANLLASRKLTSINEAWSSDITYFEIAGKFYYITFIIDCFSRLIVGHHASKRLETIETTLPALNMAIKTRNNKIPINMIFHSDGGGQYYSKEFLALTKQHSISNSMCEYAWENGKAERINASYKK